MLLSTLRLKAGLSQTELGEILGFAQPNVARLERRPGDPGMSTIKNLSVAFGVSADSVIESIDYTNQYGGGNVD